MNLNEHIEKIKKVYEKRRDLMLDSMKKYFPADVKYTHPVGGLFTWVELREDLDAKELMKDALAEMLLMYCGSFFPNET